MAKRTNRNSDFKKNVVSAFAKMRQDSHKGMVLATALVKLKSQEKVPVDEGNLKGSHYSRTQMGRKASVGEVGCTAEYAIYVHEDLEAHHPIGEAKFLENAISENQETIMKLIHTHTKV